VRLSDTVPTARAVAHPGVLPKATSDDSATAGRRSAGGSITVARLAR
jgi:hypothetical protein